MKIKALLAAASVLLMALPVAAQSRGEWTLGLGLHEVSPVSNNGALANNTLSLDVGSAVRPTITAEYFIRDNIGIEVLAALPFEHDLFIDGLGKIGSTKHLPPTVSIQYHTKPLGRVSPFVGVGVNYTTFFSEQTRGALTGSDLHLEDSWGFAAHAGLDIALSPRDALRLDARWMDIDTEVELNGATLGTANIDPTVYGLAWVHKL